MSQDVVSDALNMIMNMKKAGKQELEIARSSKFLIEVLKQMKEMGYIDFKIDEKSKKIKVTIIKLNEAGAIKPRFNVNTKEIDKYVRRYLPAREFGFILISTSKGIMTHEEAIKNKIGGSLIAYFF